MPEIDTDIVNPRRSGKLPRKGPILSAEVLSLRVEGLAALGCTLAGCQRASRRAGPFGLGVVPALRQPTFPSQDGEPKTKGVHGDRETGRKGYSVGCRLWVPMGRQSGETFEGLWGQKGFCGRRT